MRRSPWSGRAGEVKGGWPVCGGCTWTESGLPGLGRLGAQATAQPRRTCRGSAPSSASTWQRLDQSSFACHSSPTTPAVAVGSSLKQVLQLSRDAPQWRKKASNSLPKLSRQLPGPTATSMAGHRLCSEPEAAVFRTYSYGFWPVCPVV